MSEPDYVTKELVDLWLANAELQEKLARQDKALRWLADFLGQTADRHYYYKLNAFLDTPSDKQ